MYSESLDVSLARVRAISRRDHPKRASEGAPAESCELGVRDPPVALSISALSCNGGKQQQNSRERVTKSSRLPCLWVPKSCTATAQSHTVNLDATRASLFLCPSSPVAATAAVQHLSDPTTTSTLPLVPNFFPFPFSLFLSTSPHHCLDNHTYRPSPDALHPHMRHVE